MRIRLKAPARPSVYRGLNIRFQNLHLISIYSYLSQVSNSCKFSRSWNWWWRHLSTGASC